MLHHCNNRQLLILLFIIYYTDLGSCRFTKILEKNIFSGSSVFRIIVNCLKKEYGDIMTGKIPKSLWTPSFIHTDCVEKSLNYLTVVPVRDNYINITMDCEKLCLSYAPTISTTTVTYECPNNGQVVSWTKSSSIDCRLPYVPLAKQYHCETYSSIPPIFTRLSVLYSTWILTIPSEFILRESPGVIKYSMNLMLDKKPFILNWNQYKFDVFLQIMPYALSDRCQISPLIGMASSTWFSVGCSDLSKFSQKGSFYYSIFYKSGLNTTTDIITKESMTQELNVAFQVPTVNQLTKIEVNLYVFNQLRNKACFETKAVYMLTVQPFVKAKSLDAEIVSLPTGDHRVAVPVTSSLVQAINEYSKNTTAMANVLSHSELQSRRNKNTWRREKMLKSIANIKLLNEKQDIELVKLVNNLTDVHRELTQVAHRSAGDLYKKLSLKLKQRSTTRNVKNFAKDLITGIGSLLNVISDIGESFSAKVNNGDTDSFVDVASNLVNSTTIVGQGLFKVSKFSPGYDIIKVPDMTFGLKTANSNAICKTPIKESLLTQSKLVTVTFSCSHDLVPSVNKLAISSLYMLHNPFLISELSAKINFPVLSVNIFDEHFNKIVVKSVVEFSEPKTYFNIEWINQTLKFAFRLNGSFLIPTYDSHFSIPSFEVTSPATSFRNLFINIIKGPFELDIVVQYKQTPTYKQLVTKGFHRHSESKVIVSNKGRNYSVFIPSKTGGNDTYHILIVPLENYTINNVLPFISAETNDTIFVHMQIGISSKSCFFWDSQRSLWSTDGCRPMFVLSHKVVKCECLHLSILSANLLVLPNLVNPIDDSYLFLQFFDNPIVFAAIVYIWTLYFCLLYWCRRMDQKNKALAIITVLNSDFNGHIYLIGLRTRWLPRAGTTAKVFLILFGSEANSTVYYLRDAHKPCFQTGDESWFLLTTEQSIGELQEVSIWHDNSGPSPDWRLDHVIVQDFESKKIWVLLCSDWISIKRGLKSRHVLLVPLTLKQLRSRRLYQFRSKIVEGFRNSHQWMSVLLKTPQNSFTHTQRLTCAFNLLLSIMLGNIMFYGIPTDDPNDQILTGPIQLSLKSLIISIETSLVIIPIGFFLTKLFSNISPKSTHLQFRKKNSNIKMNTENQAEFRISSNTNSRSMVNKRTTGKKNMASTLNKSSHVTRINSERVYKSQVVSYTEQKTLQTFCENDNIKTNHDNRFTCSVPHFGNLPWWFIYIAWIINISFCLVCTYFIILYGFKYGQQASFDWLCSFFFTFFQSAVFEQPAGIISKAFLIAVLLSKRITLAQFTLSIKKMDDDELLERIREHCHFEEDFTFVIPTPNGQRLSLEIKTNEK